MYGLIGKMAAAPGQCDALATVLLAGTGSMPGCLSYIVATDPSDPDALWITEVWDSQDESSGLPRVAGSASRDRARNSALGGTDC